MACHKREVNCPPPTEFQSQIYDFCLDFNAFFSSPLGSLYKIHRPEGLESLESVNSTMDRLKTAVLNGILAIESEPGKGAAVTLRIPKERII